ncbi:MAG: hypothetical protein KGO79_05350 [Betaproteobacteria bacterium]|nr:hypothetical protein [Betaproteobacteria bacterium]
MSGMRKPYDRPGSEYAWGVEHRKFAVQKNEMDRLGQAKSMNGTAAPQQKKIAITFKYSNQPIEKPFADPKPHPFSLAFVFARVGKRSDIKTTALH